MNHLTVDDLIRFVSFETLDDETIEFSKTVNGHIRNCEDCRALVRSFQIIHDEFEKLCSHRDFKKYIRESEIAVDQSQSQDPHENIR